MATFKPAGEFSKFTVGDNSIVAGDVVAIERGTSNTVIRANASDSTKMPAIGFAKSIRNNSCIVQLSYIIKLSGIAINPGSEYWVDPSSTGKITATAPDSTDIVVQKVGLGKTANTLLIRMDTQTISL